MFISAVFSCFCAPSFRLFSRRKTPGKKTNRRKDARQKDEINTRQKDKKTPCKKSKRRKDATGKDDKIIVSNGVFSHGVFRSPGPKGHSELLPHQCVRRTSCVIRQHLNTNIQLSSSIELLDLQFSNYTWSMS